MPSAADIIKDYVSEFSRLQNWMLAIRDTNPDTYNSMHDRYLELKLPCQVWALTLQNWTRLKSNMNEQKRER